MTDWKITSALVLIGSCYGGAAPAQGSPPMVGGQPLLQVKPLPPAPATCNAKLIKPIADKVTEEIGIMINFTKAVCLPTVDGTKCSLLCFSDLTINGMNRNIVLTFITASAGKKMRDAGISKFASILFADRNLLEAKHALKITAARASTLQAAFASTGEKPEVMASRVGSEYSEIEFKR
jgi:hypothetical protein